MRRVLVLIALCACAIAAQRQAPPDRLVGGNATLYLGTMAKSILVFDEASEKVVGQITMRTGIPRGMSISKDRTRFYVGNANMEDMEVVDITRREVIDTFRLSEGNKKVMIRGLEPDPSNRYAILLTKSVTKLEDRFEIGPPTLLQYDLKEHKVLRTIEWPKKEEREFARLLFSPDGKLLYFFSDDILVYDTTDFKEVDRWELSRPLEPGFGRFNFGFPESLYEEPGFYTGLFNVSDPVQNRRIMGIARVHLAGKSVDFYPLGPATGVSFALAPGRKRAYGLHSEVGKYEFWTFDLENRRVVSKVEFPGRPRMALKPSSNGRILYIYQAGPTIDLYDASSYKYLRTITLDADMMTDLYILPPKATAPTSGQ